MHSTRERILAHLKREPELSVGALARALDLAPMTIRQHLTKMAGEGLVDAKAERRPTGRPAHLYFLTPAGEDWFPKAYDRLAGLLIDELATGNSPAADDLSEEERQTLLFRRLARRAADPHRPALNGLAPWERLQAAVEILRDESGFTELDEGSLAPVVREYNCVYQRVAERHDAVCTFHTEYLKELVGVPVELESCQCAGANACRFRVQL